MPWIVQGCIDCYGTQSKNDYIWTGEVMKGSREGKEAP
jgi:hypothetical protein